MEKYFIVTEKSDLHKDYLDYRENSRLINEHYKEFAKENDIEAEEYCPSNKYLHIIPTEKDLERFDKVLLKPTGQGLRSFKLNSKIAKNWAKSLTEKGLKVLSKPYIPFYFRNGFGRSRTRIFNIGEAVYCSYEADRNNIECPEGFIEIKASEFYKIIENNTK